MSLKDNFKKYFSKKRHIAAVVVIAILLITIGLNDYLPVGPGNYNQKQIDKIHSSAPSDNFSFAVMGDNKNSFKIFSKILKDIDNNHYTFAIDVGDLVYDGEKAKYRIFYNMIKNEQTPFLVAVGNHDIREGGAENYFDIFGKFYYSFDYGNSLFVVLDDANETRIDAVQMKWLEEQLQRNYQHKFVFLHVPAFDPRPNTNHSLSDKQNAQEFINLMEKYKVDTVFASHIHAYFDETKNGINYIITGGAGSELMGTDPDHYFYHYIKVDVNGDKANKEVIRFPSPDYNWFDRFFYDIWIYINAFWVTHKLLVILLLIIFILLIDLFIGKVKKYLKEFAAIPAKRDKRNA
ncbi:MAG: metallophosphoesterase [Candidatus Jorgensenbacteria bacterium]